jgi:hypothetical protein
MGGIRFKSWPGHRIIMRFLAVFPCLYRKVPKYLDYAMISSFLAFSISLTISRLIIGQMARDRKINHKTKRPYAEEHKNLPLLNIRKVANHTHTM